MSLLSCVKWYKLYLDIFEVGCDFQDVEFDQSNKKKFDEFEIFPRTLHSEELNLTVSLETNKNLDASGRTEMENKNVEIMFH